MISSLIRLPVAAKRWITIVYDMAAAGLALWIAWSLRLGEVVDMSGYAHLVVAAVLITVGTFIYMGYYRVTLSQVGTEIIRHSFNSVLLSTTGLALFIFLYRDTSLPRSVILIYGLTLFLICIGGRMVASRILREPNRSKTRIAIYGTGEAGVQLAGALQKSDDLLPFLWLDDDKQKWGSEILGMRVHSPEDFDRLVKAHDIREVMVASPGVSRTRRRELLDRFSRYPVRVHLLPMMSEAAQGRIGMDDLHEIDAEDLLERGVTERDEHLMRVNIRDKVVMVSGAGGSIGSELCRQAVRQGPRALVMVDQSEYALYRIEHDIREGGFENIIPVLGSVCDRESMEKIMRERGVETVYHAAAYKHVHLVEMNVAAGLRNNTFGTLALADAAESAGVKTFVLISTDKSVKPRGMMGASKRLAEMILQAYSDAGKTTCFCIVRFGNVLDSSGSIVPLFKQQIRDRKPLTLTHADMVRYFMTINEAVELVIQAGAMASGGEVFVLDMGEPVKIDALARKMIRLNGLQVRDESNPDGDIEIVYTGVRPGEKISEELSIEGLDATDRKKIRRSRDGFVAWSELNDFLAALDGLLSETQDEKRAVELLNTLEDMCLEER